MKLDVKVTAPTSSHCVLRLCFELLRKLAVSGPIISFKICLLSGDSLPAMSSASVFSGVTNKEIVEYITSTEAEIFECRFKKRIKQNTKAGYGNLMQHVRNMHQDYTSVIPRHVRSQFQKFVPNKTQNIYSWLDWVICKGLPFTFVDDAEKVSERRGNFKCGKGNSNKRFLQK